MIEIRELPPEHFGKLEGVFAEVFASDPPLPENSTIFCAFEDGRFAGFLLAEKAVILGQLCVAPASRKNDLRIVNSLIESARRRYDGKETVAAVASEPRFEKLFASYGMQKISGSFFRKNIDF